MAKPIIITHSDDDATVFEWVSGGWFHSGVRHTVAAKRLMAIADECIEAGQDVPDVIHRLEVAGFEVRRGPTLSGDAD